MIRPALMALGLMVCPAFAGQTLVYMRPAAPETQICLSGYRETLLRVEALQAMLERATKALEEADRLQRSGMAEQGTECTPKASPAPPKATTAPELPRKAAKRLPCKKGRHRNAKGICGKW